MLAAYVSGHGFGHATRTGQVLAALQGLAPGVAITVVTQAPEALFRAAMPRPFAYRRLATDVGIVQKDALLADEEATAEKCRAFAEGWPALVREEAAWLRASAARLVYGDIPPLAFAAAREARIPAVALGNFSWDWIYADVATRVPAIREAANAAAEAYAHVDLLLRLPFAGDMSAFPRIEDVPLVARKPRLGKTEARHALTLADETVVLLSFGGVGLPGFRTEVLADLEGFHFLSSLATSADPPNVTAVNAATLERIGLGYEDLVAAADVVVTKPGYGIVTDAIAARTRMVYTERGDFAEYPVLVEGMAEYLPCVHVSNVDLRAGRLRPVLDQVLRMPFPPVPRLDGAQVAAQRIVGMGGFA